MENDYQFRSWFTKNWSRTALPAAFLLFLLTPLVLFYGNIPLMIVFLQLPLYMIHQYEEHARGAFKSYTNKLFGNGAEILTDRAIMRINVLLVWVANLLLLYLTAFWTLQAGVVSLYLTFLNGAGHVVLGFIRGEANPGYWSSLFLFLPVSSIFLLYLTVFHEIFFLDHLLGIGGSVLLHLPFLILILVRKKNLASRAVSGS